MIGMELLLKLLALCIVGAVLSLLLREQKQVLAIFVILALAAAVVPALLKALGEILAFFDGLVQLSGLPYKVFAPLLKVVGIAAVTQIGTSLCKEAESDTAAALLEMGGTCCALLTALPLMTAVLDLLGQLL